MQEVKTSNGNNIFYITEEEKLRVLRNRMEAERKANRKRRAFFTKETALQKCFAIILAVIALVAAKYVQDGGLFIIPLLFICLPFFFCKRNIFEKVEVEEWEEQ